MLILFYLLCLILFYLPIALTFLCCIADVKFYKHPGDSIFILNSVKYMSLL